MMEHQERIPAEMTIQATTEKFRNKRQMVQELQDQSHFLNCCQVRNEIFTLTWILTQVTSSLFDIFSEEIRKLWSCNSIGQTTGSGDSLG
jgi:ribosomal silencing factor RsfS